MSSDVRKRLSVWIVFGVLAAFVAGLVAAFLPCLRRHSSPGGDIAARRADPSDRSAADVRELRLHPKLKLEAEMEKGETHTYRLVLDVGEYLHLGIEQIGVDLAVSVSKSGGVAPTHDRPDGEVPLLWVDGPTGNRGTEDVVLVSETRAAYEVELRALNGTGKYVAQVVAHRPATPNDRSRAASDVAFYSGQWLERCGRGSPSDAADRYRAAAGYAVALGDDTRQARALYHLGKLLASSERPIDAIAPLEAAVEYYRSLGNHRQEAVTLARLGGIFRRQGRLERARSAYEDSLDLWQRLGEPKEEASQLNNLGLVAKNQGRARDALEYYNRSLDLWQKLGRRIDQAATLSNLGVLYSMLGEHRTAIDLHRRALTLLGAGRDPGEASQLAVTMTKLADARLGLGEADASLGTYREALDLRRKIRDERGEATTLNGLGWAYRMLGQPREALDAFRTALAIFRRRDELKAQATVLNNLGSLQADLGDGDRALDAFREALAAARTVRHRHAEASALLGIARLARDKDKLDAAQRNAEEALEVYESIRVAATVPENLGLGDLRSSYLASKLQHYEFLIDLLSERHQRQPTAGYDSQAFAISERARARSLLEALIQARDPASGGPSGESLRRLEELRDEVNSRHIVLLNLVRTAAPEQQIERLDAEVRRLVEEMQRTEAALHQQNPRWADLVTPPILSLEEIQTKLLDDETLLLEIFLGEDTSFLWAVTRSGHKLHMLPDRGTLERAALRFYAALLESQPETGEVAVQLAADDLSRLLLDPVANLLDYRRLVIVAPGALQYVPFAALSIPSAGEPRQLLVANHEIVSLPSASVLVALRRHRADRRSTVGLLAVVAAPELGTELPDPNPSAPFSVERHLPPPLYHARKEAEAILRLASDQPTLSAFGVDASRDLVESGHLLGYQILHFATHGILDTEHPELSALLLSTVDPEGQPVDGYLRAYEILPLNLPTELVVLSACRTALGKQVRGEGLVGLTRAFMVAGADRVVVSLWNVDDRATSELMERFYFHLLRDRQPPARALQEAQIDMLSQPRWRAPYFWGGFVLQGDWRPLPQPSEVSRPKRPPTEVSPAY